MENAHHRIENLEKSKEFSLSKKNKEVLNMDSTSNKTNAHASQISLSSGKILSNTNSPKMGSRRIFTPQFKLQVLESYRNDHDCKGNQRATARKYNIHRRQIQKWLQCEPSLRSSVANINQNSVKHQFHNVSMQQQQTKNIIAPQSSVNSLSYTSSQLHSAHLCLDSNKISTSHKSINMPSQSSCVSASSAQETQDIMIAVSPVADTIARTNDSGTSTVAATVASSIIPSGIISANGNINSSISPLLHHHHYGIPTYSNISSTPTVPILVHHLTNTQQTSYQYHNHNIPYSSQILSHHQIDKQHPTSYFAPVSLPTNNVLSTAASASNSYAGEDNREKLDLFSIGTKTYSKVAPEKSFLFGGNQFEVSYECHDGPRVINYSNTIESFTSNNFNGDSLNTYPYGPMDLSLRHRRDTKPELIANIKSSFEMTEIPVKKVRSNNAIDVVDLTYRKRRVFNNSHSRNDYNNMFHEKLQKFSNPEEVRNNLDSYNLDDNCSHNMTTNASKSNEEDDIEIEVGIEEKFPPTSKPVKLFKPYLLDECENKDDNFNINSTNKLSRNEKSEEIQQISKKDIASGNKNTFPEIAKENISICVDINNFSIESRSESPRSVCSPATYIPTLSPTFNYPKGSPSSSGYESSTSTYSDTSLSSRNDTYAYGPTYSVNLQMQTIYHENIHERDDSNSIENNSNIALLV